MIDPLNFLTLERTFCVFCFVSGKRPPEHEAGILGGVRFGRMLALADAHRRLAYECATRRRVLDHLRSDHPDVRLANVRGFRP